MAFLNDLIVTGPSRLLGDVKAPSIDAKFTGSKTVEGDVITITDAANLYAEEVSIKVNPYQDLHGYDSAWIGGAENNKLNLSNIYDVTQTSTYTYDELLGKTKVAFTNNSASSWVQASIKIPIALNGKTLTLSGTNVVLSKNSLDPRIYIMSSSVLETIKISANSSFSRTFTLPSGSDQYIVLVRLSQDQSVLALNDWFEIYGLQIVEGSTVLPFSPYKNICPISPYNLLNINRVGKNLLSLTVKNVKALNTAGTWSGNTYTLGNATYELIPNDYGNIENIIINGGNTNNFWLGSYTLDDDIYTVSDNFDQKGNYPPYVFAENSNATNNQNRSFNIGGYTEPTEKRFGIWIGDTNVSNAILYPMICRSTDPDPYIYSSYDEQDITIQLGQDVYGGTLNTNNNGSADFVVTYRCVDLPSLAWVDSIGSGYRFKTSVLSDAKLPVTSAIVPNAISSCFPVTAYNSGYSASNSITIIFSGSGAQGQVWCNCEYATSLSAFKSIIAGQQLCYELANPFIIHISADQLKLLKGCNTITTNGAKIQLKYQPDNVMGETIINQTKYINTITNETDTTNTKPYLYRLTQTTGDRLYNKLVGCSFAVNQLVQNGDFSDGYTKWGDLRASLSVSDGVLTATCDEAGYVTVYTSPSYKFNDLINRVVLVRYDVNISVLNKAHSFSLSADSINTNAVAIPYSKTDTWMRVERICKPTSSGATVLRIGLSNCAVGNTMKLRNVTIIDLTQYFGHAIANTVYTMEQCILGNGIAWLKSYGFFTKNYYAYNAGSLASVKPTAHKMVGKNLFDAQQTIGGTVADGQIVIDDRADGWISASDIVIPRNTTIYVSIKDKGTYSGSFYPELFDENHVWVDNNLIPSIQFAGITAPYNTTFTLSSNVKYIRLRGWNANGGASKIKTVEVCVSTINISYEPYTEYTYPLTTELRGVPTFVNGEIVYDGDINEGDGVTQRKYGIVDLGSLSYFEASSANNNRIFCANISDIKKGTSGVVGKIICPKYATYKGDDVWNENTGISMWSSNATIAIYDPSYVSYSTSNFKTAMSGVYLVYELATPTTESSIPFTNPQICDKNGTEEYIDDRELPIPVGHITKYVDVPNWMEKGYYKDFRDRADNLENIFNNKTLINKSEYVPITSANAWINTGMTITIPANSFYAIHALQIYVNKRPSGIILSTHATDPTLTFEYHAISDYAQCHVCGYTIESTTLYLYIKAEQTHATGNICKIMGWYEPAVYKNIIS